MANHCCGFEDVKSAADDIRPYIHRTPLMTCTALNKMSGRELFLKAENFQKTGSFKLRGAMNAVIKLQKQNQKSQVVVTESSGNNGQAVAKAAQTVGLPSYVVMPDWSYQSKINSVKNYGATIIMDKGNDATRKRKTQEIVENFGARFINDCQDPEIIAGQGTAALEILEDNPDVDIIVAAVGGGGLISGTAIVAKTIKPSIKVIAAEPEKANDCYLSKLEGEHLTNTDDPDTIADGARVGLNSSTWPIIRDLVDDVITVSEEDIIEGMLTVWERAKLVVEPTAGVSIAAVMSEKFRKIEGKNVAVVLCGGNVDVNSIPSLLTRRKS